MVLVLIETLGNQEFIFASNKLRENVGASELVWRIGDLCRRLANYDGNEIPLDNRQRITHIAEWLDGESMIQGASELLHHVNQFIRARISSNHQCAVLMATSGKALIRVPNEATAQALIRAVTYWARCEAPGLDVHGLFREEPHDSRTDYQNFVTELHSSHWQHRSEIPSQQERFQRIPIASDCRTTNFPANRLFPLPHEGEQPLSVVAIAKRKVAESGWRRLTGHVPDVCFATTIDELDRMDDLEWLSIVHADGNGLGQIFIGFGTACGDQSVQGYSTLLDAFSIALDQTTSAAFQEAAQVVAQQWQRIRKKSSRRGRQTDFIPLIPLVLGGDDLTVVCEGRLAIAFTTAYLTAFERLAAENQTIKQICQHVSACAGIAIIKPHFPFSAGYRLSEQLLRRAKAVKQKCEGRICSAFDFHVLRDSSDADLERIETLLRLHPTPATEEQLFHRPIVVTPMDRISTDRNDTKRRWAESHHHDQLTACVDALNASDEDGRKRLPNSLMHELRSSLFSGKQIADEQFRLSLTTRELEDFAAFVPANCDAEKASLFHEEAGIAFTRLLDAMDVAPFWPVAITPARIEDSPTTTSEGNDSCHTHSI
jgi:hypothetical protein